MQILIYINPFNWFPLHDSFMLTILKRCTNVTQSMKSHWHGIWSLKQSDIRMAFCGCQNSWHLEVCVRLASHLRASEKGRRKRVSGARGTLPKNDYVRSINRAISCFNKHIYGADFCRSLVNLMPIFKCRKSAGGGGKDMLTPIPGPLRTTRTRSRTRARTCRRQKNVQKN